MQSAVSYTHLLYRDSSDRLIATTNEPKLTMGHLAVLEVADTGKMGAFLEWGLEKDLFLPFKEQDVYKRQEQEQNHCIAVHAGSGNSDRTDL